MVLGTGERAKYIAWALADEGIALPVSSGNILRALVRTLPVFRARTSFTALKLLLISDEAKSSGFPKTVSGSICPGCVIQAKNGRGSETKGFMKALIDTESDRILGFTVFGVGAERSWVLSRSR